MTLARPPFYCLAGVLPHVARTTSEIFRDKILRRFSLKRQRVRMATASPNILVVEDDRETRTLIIMLTARGEDIDRILGLEMGADDYLAKPFNPRELLARINAVLRRQAAAQTASATNGATALGFLGWRIDFRLRELRNPAGARVAMTSAEFDLLRTFCERPGRVLSRDSLLDLTQGRNAGSFERSIDVLVSRIRRKIETDPLEPTMIKTVRSGGYMFTPRVDAATIPTNG